MVSSATRTVETDVWGNLDLQEQLPMDLAKVLLQLHEELANLNAAIVSLERLQEGGRRRGRPPAWLTEVKKAERTVRRHRSQVEVQAVGRK